MDDEDGELTLAAGEAAFEGLRLGMERAAADIRAMGPRVSEAVRQALAAGVTPIDLTGPPKAFVFVQPGWGKRLAALAPREHDIASPPYDAARHGVAEYCNVCENFPCLGGHPGPAEG